MQRELWGPSLWSTIHYIALAYPAYPSAQDRAYYKNFYTALANVIPCQKCSYNYKRHLQELPLDEHLQSTDQLFEWTVKLHNIVNRENNKRTWTTQQAREFYLHQVKPNTGFDYNMLYVVGIIILIFVCLYMSKRKLT